MSEHFSLQDWINTPQELFDEEAYFDAEVRPLIYAVRDACAARNIPFAVLVDYAKRAADSCASVLIAAASVNRSSYDLLAAIQISQAENVREAVEGFATVTSAYKAKRALQEATKH